MCIGFLAEISYKPRPSLLDGSEKIISPEAQLYGRTDEDKFDVLATQLSVQGWGWVTGKKRLRWSLCTSIWPFVWQNERKERCLRELSDPSTRVVVLQEMFR